MPATTPSVPNTKLDCVQFQHIDPKLSPVVKIKFTCLVGPKLMLLCLQIQYIMLKLNLLMFPNISN